MSVVRNLHRSLPLLQSSLLHRLINSNSPSIIRREEWRSWMGREAARDRNMATLARGKAKMDIGARARRNQQRRLWTYGLSMSAVAGFIIVVLSSYQEYLVFYLTPTDALEKFKQDPSKNKFRLGGLVLEGSLVEGGSSKEEMTEFVVTDLVTEILVRYKDPLPDLVAEGRSVVAEGFIRPWISEDNNALAPLSSTAAATEKARGIDCYFSATSVLAKHDEKYMPKEVAAVIEKNRAAKQAAEASQPHRSS